MSLHEQSDSLVYFLLIGLCSPESLYWYNSPGGIVYLYSIILGQTFLVYSIQHRISCNNHPFLFYLYLYCSIFIHIVLSLSILFYLYPYLFCLRIHCHKAIYYHSLFHLDCVYHFSSDNNCFGRYSMIPSFDFSSFSKKEILSFKMLTISYDESFVISLVSFPEIIVSYSKQSLSFKNLKFRLPPEIF